MHPIIETNVMTNLLNLCVLKELEPVNGVALAMGLPEWQLGFALACLIVLTLAFGWGRTRGNKQFKKPTVVQPPAEPAWNPDSRELTARFTRAIPEVRSDLDLSVVAHPKDEFFNATQPRAFCGIPLGTNEVAMRVRATFRYHVSLRQDWLVVRDGHTAAIIAPSLQATLPVAFDSHDMEVSTKRGWARWSNSVRELADGLGRTVTNQLGHRAQSPERIALYRHTARESVTEFAQNVLRHTNDLRRDRLQSISVHFHDEPSAQPWRELMDRQCHLAELPSAGSRARSEFCRG